MYGIRQVKLRFLLLLFCSNIYGQSDLNIAKKYFREGKYSDALNYCDYYLNHIDNSNTDAKNLRRDISVAIKVDSLIQLGKCSNAKIEYETLISQNSILKEKLDKCKPKNKLSKPETQNTSKSEPITSNTNSTTDDHSTHIDGNGNVVVTGVINAPITITSGTTAPKPEISTSEEPISRPVDTITPKDSKCSNYLPLGIPQFFCYDKPLKGTVFFIFEGGFIAGSAYSFFNEYPKYKRLAATEQNDSKISVWERKRDCAFWFGGIGCLVGFVATYAINVSHNKKDCKSKGLCIFPYSSSESSGLTLTLNF